MYKQLVNGFFQENKLMKTMKIAVRNRGWKKGQKDIIEKVQVDTKRLKVQCNEENNHQEHTESQTKQIQM